MARRELADRPGLAALLDRLESNGVRTVVVERADRLARDLMVQEVILAQFAKIGARILTSDGVDLTCADDDPTRRLVRQILGAVAEFEKNVLVLKLRAARERKRRRGERVEGVKPYGHFPAEAAIIERMRMLRRKAPKGARASLARCRRTVEQRRPQEPRRPRVERAARLPRAENRVAVYDAYVATTTAMS